ncbi:MAG TPA: site-specific DNA-methyltransferase [Syntrophomonadaceae bacterium]|nr:site-specific DNA-methyltransferase [Syntrophomonadaceae bacterium]
MKTGLFCCGKLAQKAGDAMQEQKLIELTWESKDRNHSEPIPEFRELERVNINPFIGTQSYYQQAEIFAPPEAIQNTFCLGDNLAFMRNPSLWAGYPRVDLIYIDPPYMTDIAYNSSINIGSGPDQHPVVRPAFHDRWTAGLTSYLDMLYPRLAAMKEMLSEEGSIFVHVDWHASHYVRVLLDEIFGMDHFINEIAWCFGGGGNSRRHFHRKHDSILWYARTPEYIYNPQYRPYTQGTVERGLTRVKGDRYQLHQDGALMQDWWTDINKILSPTAHENLKYPTQKPKQLLKRLVEAASRPGSLVADFFSGSGTLAEVCNQTGRRWLLCDNSPLGLQTTMYRLIRNGSSPFTIIVPDQYESPPGGEIVLKKPRLSSFDQGYVLVDLGIDDYRPFNIEPQLQRQHCSDYIEFWEIDLDYQGIFNSCCQVIREKNRFQGPLTLDILVRVEAGRSRQIAIKVWDVWANQTMGVVDIKA